MNTVWFESAKEKELIIKYDSDLDRFTKACIDVGSVHLHQKNVIHIAGTNGKGSTAAFIESILFAHGFSVNKFTSPHLLSFNERIRINGADISDEILLELQNKAFYLIDKFNLSYFEFATILMFMAFSKNQSDFNVIEVGLGGLLDATNVIENKLIAVITSISHDHEDILGKGINNIAKNKAGIIKNTDNVVIGYQSFLSAKNEILKTPNNHRFFIGGDHWFANEKNDCFDYVSSSFVIDNITPSLPGKHQFYNAANAIATCEKILSGGIDDKKVKNAIANTYWPARIERIKYKNHEVIVDGAHNEDGLATLIQYLKENKEKNNIGIFCCMSNKDANGMISRLEDLFDLIICPKITGPMSNRALDNLYICELIRNEKKEAISVDNVIDAIEIGSSYQKTLVIFGSLYLAGEALRVLKR